MQEDNTGFDSTKSNFGQERPSEQQRSSNEFREDWNQANHPQENKKILAGILAIVLGGFGIHKFILGYTQEGIIQIVITVVTCGIGSIIGLIEGIIYLTKSDEEFYQTYQVGKRGWF